MKGTQEISEETKKMLKNLAQYRDMNKQLSCESLDCRHKGGYFCGVPNCEDVNKPVKNPLENIPEDQIYRFGDDKE